jgi:hypothetical protein
LSDAPIRKGDLPGYLAALASTSGRGGGGRRRIGARRALIISPIVHIAIDAAIAVLVGPNGAGKAADHRTGNRAFKDADARN